MENTCTCTRFQENTTPQYKLSKETNQLHENLRILPCKDMFFFWEFKCNFELQILEITHMLHEKKKKVPKGLTNLFVTSDYAHIEQSCHL